ncbi:hypothetical protein KSS87_001047 [Heliosperma pusillum]|nr:hypothetical protein KSS87_001047 [Heliosperma pusillum]
MSLPCFISHFLQCNSLCESSFITHCLHCNSLCEQNESSLLYYPLFEL